MLKKLLKQNPLYVFALEMESGDTFKSEHLLHTGLGKVNAAYYLTKQLSKDKPTIIVNLGSVGSSKYPQGTVVCCSQFIQRDMEATALGVPKYTTPFGTEDAILNYGVSVRSLPQGICGSGDSFVTQHDSPDYNIVDMEAYTLAYIAKKEGIPFLCLKYVSDGADKHAVNDWNKTVGDASKALYKALQDIINRDSEEILYF